MRARYAAAAAMALALLPHVPAQAALPKSQPTSKKACPNNPKKTLRIWAHKAPFAVDNPCSDWFVMWHRERAEPVGSTYDVVNVAGYSKVNLPYNMKTRLWGWDLEPDPAMCGDRNTNRFIYYGDGHKLDLEGSGLGCEYDF